MPIPRTDVVGIGDRLPSPTWNASTPESFTILGAWDSDPDKGVISYLTAVGQALLNAKPGQEVEVPVEGGKRRYRVDSIRAFKPAPEAAPAPGAPSPAAPPETTPPPA